VPPATQTTIQVLDSTISTHKAAGGIDDSCTGGSTDAKNGNKSTNTT